MIRQIQLVLLLLVMLVHLGIGPFPSHKAEQSSVSIQSCEDGACFVVGSGVAIKTWRHKGILTAAHVASIPGDKKACSLDGACVALPGSYIVGSTEWETEPQNDWAVFPAPFPEGIKPASMRWAPLSPGDSLFHVGFAFGVPWRSTGVLAGEDQGRLLADLDVAPGSSGGGVFDSRGRLVGLITSIEVRESRVTGIPETLYWRSLIVPIRNL